MTRCALVLTLCLSTAAAVAQPPERRQGQGPEPANAGPSGFGPGGPNGFGPGGPMFGPRSNPMFEAIDADGDGMITKSELRRAVPALKNLDADRDGNITLAEASPQRGPFGDPAQMIDRLMQGDADGDGKLTAEELPPSMSRIVQEADTNGDGALDRDELTAGMEQMRTRFRRGGGRGAFGGPGFDPQQMAQQMRQSDRNQDGRLTVDEVPPQMMPMLRGADQNNDQAIDAQELQAVVERMNERARRRGQFGPGGPGAAGGQDDPTGGQGR